MRCPDCNKFVSYDTDVEPEQQDDPEVSTHGDEANLRASFRRVLTCAECGTELKEATIDFDVFESLNIDEDDKKKVDCDHDWDVTEVNAEPTTGAITVDRNGRRIRSARYMKTTYGVELTVLAQCQNCDHEVSFSASEEMQASSFDEIA